MFIASPFFQPGKKDSIENRPGNSRRTSPVSATRTLPWPRPAISNVATFWNLRLVGMLRVYETRPELLLQWEHVFPIGRGGDPCGQD